MTLGVNRGEVRICPHEPEWEIEAARTVEKLKALLGDKIRGIEHVGSTAIRGIMAKPIIDIALAVDRFEDILAFEAELLAEGFYYRPKAQEPLTDQKLFACGSYYDGSGRLQTHFIHVVLTDSQAWKNYIGFRDYMNQNPDMAKKYEAIKFALSSGNRAEYTGGKHGFIADVLEKIK